MVKAWKKAPKTHISSGWEVAIILFKAVVFLPARFVKRLFGRDIEVFTPVIFGMKKFLEATYTVWLCLFIFFSFIAVILFDVVSFFVLEPGDVFSERIYTVVTHLFMHGSVSHLLGNLAVLFGVGRIVERYFGGNVMIGLFLFFGAMTGALMSATEIWIENGAVGASAAITGLGVVALLRNPMDLLFIPPAILPVFFVIPTFILTDILFLGVSDGVGREAHLVGGFLGLIYAWISTSTLFLVSRTVWVGSVFLLTLLVLGLFGF